MPDNRVSFSPLLRCGRDFECEKGQIHWLYPISMLTLLGAPKLAAGTANDSRRLISKRARLSVLDPSA